MHAAMSQAKAQNLGLTCREFLNITSCSWRSWKAKELSITKFPWTSFYSKMYNIDQRPYYQDQDASVLIKLLEVFLSISFDKSILGCCLDPCPKVRN